MTQIATKTYGEQASRSEREQLILSHLPLIRHVLGKILVSLPGSVDQENLEAAGALGLVDAANRFDPSKGIKFNTYAYIRIRGAIIDELRRNCPLPQHVLERVVELRRLQEELDGATLEDLVQATGWTEKEVIDCLSAMQLARMMSLEEAGRFVGGNALSPDQEAELQERKHLLAQGIVSLPEKERMVVTLYYLEDLRLREIAAALQLSESRISRILTGAIGVLRDYVRTREGS